MKTIRHLYSSRHAIKPIAMGCILITAASAHAEKTIPTSIWGDKTEINLGIGMGAIPRYLGSDESKALVAPTLGIYRGIFYVDSVRGIGMEYQTDSGFYISPAISYDFGRSEKNDFFTPGSKKLTGMGKVHGSTTFNIYATQRITDWLYVNGEADFRVAGQKNRGNRYRLGLESTVFKNDKDEVTLGANIHAGDRNYNQTYFGVSQAQSQTSKFKKYASDSGIYAYSLSADWNHDFDKHWSLFTAINVMQFADEAKHSPVVQEKTGVTGLVSVNYTF